MRFRDDLWSSSISRLTALLLLALFGLACGAGSDVPGGGALAPEEVLSLVGAADAPLILDTRTSEEFAAGHVPGAVNIPYTEVAERVAEIEPYRDRGVVVYCEKGRRAEVAAGALEAAGFDDVRLLEGHMSGWRASGHPVEP
jgi:phage shock protein E